MLDKIRCNHNGFAVKGSSLPAPATSGRRHFNCDVSIIDKTGANSLELQMKILSDKAFNRKWSSDYQTVIASMKTISKQIKKATNPTGTI